MATQFERPGLTAARCNIEQWQKLMEQGNQAYKQGDHDTALWAYHRGLTLAQRLIRQHPHPQEAVAALVISRHNLSDQYLSMNQSDQALEHLCCAHRQLISLVHHAPDPLKRPALQHLSVTRMELQRFIRSQGPHPDVHATLAITH